MARQNEALQGALTSAQGGTAIVTSDVAPAAGSPIYKALYVGVAGNVKVRHPDGSTPTYTAMQAGVIYPIQFDQVFTTLTTASSLVGLS